MSEKKMKCCLKNEVVVYKIRALTHDKKLHVFRFLLTPFFIGGFSSFQKLAFSEFKKLFPYGYKISSCDRFCIDFMSNSIDLVETCSHDFLSKYLTSIEKIE